MATRADVEAAVARLDDRVGVVVTDAETGTALAFRQPADGHGAVLRALDFDRESAIREGGWSARPSDEHDLNRREHKIASRRRREALARARERNATDEEPTDRTLTRAAPGPQDGIPALPAAPDPQDTKTRPHTAQPSQPTGWTVGRRRGVWVSREGRDNA